MQTFVWLHVSMQIHNSVTLFKVVTNLFETLEPASATCIPQIKGPE